MSLRGKKLGAKCDECPLRDAETLLPCCPPRPKAAVYIDGPDRLAQRIGKLLTGELSRPVWDTLKRYGIEREELFISAAALCGPPDGVYLTAKQRVAVLNCCRPRIARELKRLGPDVPIMVAGTDAFKTIFGQGGYKYWRGYPLRMHDMRETWIRANKDIANLINNRRLFPTFSLAYLNEKPAHLAMWLTDWERALAWSRGELSLWEWPQLEIGETDESIKLFEKIVSQKHVGFDVEGGGTDVFTAPLLCVGFGADKVGGVSFRWPIQDGRLEHRIRETLKNKRPELVMQNGGHDTITMRLLGIPVEGFTFDTLVAAHTVSPQIDKDLGALASYEHFAERWKVQFKVGGDEKGLARFVKAPIEELMLYNAKDAYMTDAIRPPLELRVAKTDCGEYIFNMGMEVMKLGVKMTEKGVLVDQDRRTAHGETLSEKIALGRKLFDNATGGLNPRSTAQMRDRFFGHYGAKPRSKTETGAYQIDRDMLSHIIADEELPAQARKEAKLVVDISALEKLKSTYVEAPLQADGCVHPLWKQTTISWRWNSSAPNMQNVPAGPPRTKFGMRDMYIARPGMTFVGADYSQLEARIQALRAGEQKLIEGFHGDFDCHTFITSLCLGKPEDEVEKWERKMFKSLKYGYDYGSSAAGAHRNLVLDFPAVTLKQVEDMFEELKHRFPAVEARRQQDIETARNKGYVELPFGGGRFEFYMGQVRPTQVCNLPMQRGAAFIMNPMILALDAALEGTGHYIVMQIHDEVILEGPDEAFMIEMLVKHMPQRKAIGLNEMVFPITVCKGDRWSDMEEVGAYGPE